MMKDGKIHVLVVDDNEDILSMLQVMLTHQGYYTSVLDSAQGLPGIIKAWQPDVLLMDKLLSGSDGCDFCRQIKADEAIAKIPVVMISAHPQAKAECLAAGADFFIEKPFEMNVLLQTVAAAINLS